MKRTQIDAAVASKRLRTNNSSSSAANTNNLLDKVENERTKTGDFFSFSIQFINEFRHSIETNNADSRPFDIFKQYLKSRDRRNDKEKRDFLIIECLDETNDALLLPMFIKKIIQITVTSSISTVHHLVFTKIIGLIIIYVRARNACRMSIVLYLVG